MQKLADAGHTVTIEAEKKTYEFHTSAKAADDPLAEWRKTKGALLGCMKGSFEFSDELVPEEPAIPIEDWGELWQ